MLATLTYIAHKNCTYARRAGVVWDNKIVYKTRFCGWWFKVVYMEKSCGKNMLMLATLTVIHKN